MGAWSPEEREDRIAAELLERAAVPLQFCAHACVVRGDERLHVLYVEVFRARRRADQVAENGCDQLTFFGASRRRVLAEDRRPARETELRDVRVLLPTLDAKGHGERVRRPSGWF